MELMCFKKTRMRRKKIKIFFWKKIFYFFLVSNLDSLLEINRITSLINKIVFFLMKTLSFDLRNPSFLFSTSSLMECHTFFFYFFSQKRESYFRIIYIEPLKKKNSRRLNSGVFVDLEYKDFPENKSFAKKKHEIKILEENVIVEKCWCGRLSMVKKRVIIFSSNWFLTKKKYIALLTKKKFFFWNNLFPKKIIPHITKMPKIIIKNFSENKMLIFTESLAEKEKKVIVHVSDRKALKKFEMSFLLSCNSAVLLGNYLSKDITLKIIKKFNSKSDRYLVIRENFLNKIYILKKIDLQETIFFIKFNTFHPKKVVFF